jgi:hypothetical protein
MAIVLPARKSSTVPFSAAMTRYQRPARQGLQLDFRSGMAA